MTLHTLNTFSQDEHLLECFISVDDSISTPDEISGKENTNQYYHNKEIIDCTGAGKEDGKEMDVPFQSSQELPFLTGNGKEIVDIMSSHADTLDIGDLDDIESVNSEQSNWIVCLNFWKDNLVIYKNQSLIILSTPLIQWQCMMEEHDILHSLPQSSNNCFQFDFQYIIYFVYDIHISLIRRFGHIRMENAEFIGIDFGTRNIRIAQSKYTILNKREKKYRNVENLYNSWIPNPVR